MTRGGAARTGGPETLAACAGAVDLLALVGLGGAFAGVVTGNLVTVAYGVGRADVTLLAASATAVAGYVIGVLVWSRVWRERPGAVLGPLLAELVLLIVVASGWLVADARPGVTASFLLLSVASVAMGGQSVAALRLHVSTTYLTGTLTGALHDLVAGVRGRRAAALRQLVALTAGAAGATVLLVHVRWAVPLLPVVLLMTTIGLQSTRAGSTSSPG